jgi:serine/threonine protein kinase/Flp pilus assembly protein TadD
MPENMDITSESANATHRTPEQFNHYRLDRRLGQGGYGEVYEAWDNVLRRKVAIKRLTGTARLEHPASLVKEARLGASLQHPAFVKIHAVEKDDTSHAIVMELVSGVTLREFIARGGASLGAILDIVGQAAAAMQAAHASGLVHGDLKPSNLMLDDDGRLRILDLGLAFHDDPQATTSVMDLEQQGTIAYMAPERLLGTAPNRLSDVYALGVVWYELLTGSRPFAALSGLALAAAQMQSSSTLWEFPASTPKAVVELVLAMTARRPDLRLASMQEVCARLAACSDAPSAHVPYTPRTPRMRDLWRTAARYKAWLALPLAVVVAFGLWQAIPHFQDGAAPFSRSATIGRALLALQSFDRPERLDEAAAHLATLLEHDPEHAAAVAGMSLLASFRYAGDTQDDTWLRRAAAAAQQALRLEPTLALSHVAEAWVQANLGRREKALELAERALALEPGNFFAALGKVTFLTRLQRYDEARAWAETMLQRHPGQRAFADALGTVHYAQGNYAAAEQAFRLSIKLQPDSSPAYANLNAALLQQGRADEALQAAQQGLQVSPSARLYTNLGNALFQRGDYVGAAGAFERAVTPPAGNPNSYLGWANLGDTLLWLPGRAEEARKAYTTARKLLSRELTRAPDDAILLSRMGLYAARAADPANATAFTAKALAAAPRSPDVRFRAALAYELLHQRDRALAELALAKKFGYPASAIDAEPEFVALRRDARYQPH